MMMIDDRWHLLRIIVVIPAWLCMNIEYVIWWWSRWHLLRTSGTTGRLVSKKGVFFSTTCEPRKVKVFLQSKMIIRWWWSYQNNKRVSSFQQPPRRMPMAMMAAFVVMNNLKMMFFCDHKLIYCHLFSPERKLVHLVFPRLASNRRNSFWNGIWSNTEGDQILILSSRWWSDYCGQILIQLECVFPAPAPAPKK